MFSPVPGVEVPRSGLKSFGFQRTEGHVHRGVDLSAPCGTPVLAASSGTVVRAHGGNGPAAGFSGYGRVIVLQVRAGGPWLLYAHLSDVYVERGDRVARGEQIGEVGDTCFRNGEPNARCGCHLHFEVSATPYPQDSEAPRLDPVAWLQGAQLHAAARTMTYGMYLWRPRV